MIPGLKTLTVIIISQVTDDCTTAADVEEKTTEGKGTERRGEFNIHFRILCVRK